MSADRPARLPPLNALRVFHTVMRHRSLRAAAEELLVSPQAVSQQIRLLEDTLGVKLFERDGRAITPNDRAILLNHSVQSAFDELAEGVRRVTKAGPRPRINVNASPYFATRYLLDRLARFRARLPDADLRLTTMVDLPNFVQDDVDVAIQWGYGGWEAYDNSLLVLDYKELCCTPLIARKLARPQDLLDQTLLHALQPGDPWPNVLRHLGVEGTENGQDLRLADAATIRRGTVAGLGVGLLSTIDADEDLTLGRLVAPFGRNIMAGMPDAQVPGFYLVRPRSHRRNKTVAAFCDWVEGEDWSRPAAGVF
jgi:LysR family transcriptional regulator, glycine cleavage system transcriptional activator